jgi:hypothetical protein
MSVPESTPSETKTLELERRLGLIEGVAEAQAADVDVPDNRALAGETDLASVGETWLRQEIKHTNQLHYVRLGMLAFLILLVLLWLASIPTLLFVAGTKWKDFEISDTVLVVYIGATTINVLGLLRIATKWLFTPKPSEEEISILDSTKDFLQKP